MLKKIKKVVTKDGEKALEISISTVVYAFLIVLVFLIGIGSVLAYGTNTALGEKIAAKIAVVVPFPAAVVDWRHPIFLKDLQANLVSVERFYETQNFAQEGLRVDFTTELGKKRLQIKQRELLDKMVEDKIVEILAKKQGIEISASEVNDAVAQKLNEFGTGDDVKKDLMKSYGWSLEDFKTKVMLPSMYTQALSAKILANNKLSDQQGKDKITAAQKDLNNGKDFAEVVRNYSEGFSKDNAGQLGWVSKEQVLPELQEVLFSGKPLAKNQIIESSIGFHILDVVDNKKQDGQDLLQVRQIFVAKKTFGDWLTSQKKQMKVFIPMNEFVWNSEAGSVDFRDPAMRQFEKEQRDKAQGDASLLL